MTISHLCPSCGHKHPRPGHCSRCRTTSARGYGAHHQRLRKTWARVIASRTQVICARCGNEITEDQKWELDHTHTRNDYLGPSHKTCNRQAGNRFLRHDSGKTPLPFRKTHVGQSASGPSVG